MTFGFVTCLRFLWGVEASLPTDSISAREESVYLVTANNFLSPPCTPSNNMKRRDLQQHCTPQLQELRILFNIWPVGRGWNPRYFLFWKKNAARVQLDTCILQTSNFVWQSFGFISSCPNRAAWMWTREGSDSNKCCLPQQDEQSQKRGLA